MDNYFSENCDTSYPNNMRTMVNFRFNKNYFRLVKAQIQPNLIF